MTVQRKEKRAAVGEGEILAAQGPRQSNHKLRPSLKLSFFSALKGGPSLGARRRPRRALRPLQYHKQSSTPEAPVTLGRVRHHSLCTGDLSYTGTTTAAVKSPHRKPDPGPAETSRILG